jgi:hypothetical protein
MVKRACYLILSNVFLYENYKDVEQNVFKDQDLLWNQATYISGYWHEFEDKLILTYDQVLMKLSKILLDIHTNDCDYNRERHLFFCDIFHRMKIDQTVFVLYADEQLKHEDINQQIQRIQTEQKLMVR